eukprot:1047457-Rhodomonas_salina.1
MRTAPLPSHCQPEPRPDSGLSLPVTGTDRHRDAHSAGHWQGPAQCESSQRWWSERRGAVREWEFASGGGSTPLSLGHGESGAGWPAVTLKGRLACTSVEAVRP